MIDTVTLSLCAITINEQKGRMVMEKKMKLEERSTLDYFERMKQYDMTVNELSQQEFHMLVTANVSALFEAVIHDFSHEKAMHYAETLDIFFSAGWKKILGI